MGLRFRFRRGGKDPNWGLEPDIAGATMGAIFSWRKQVHKSSRTTCGARLSFAA